MTRYLLDTNIISNATKPLPAPPLTEWMAKQVDDDLFICSVSLAEIYRGILEKPSGNLKNGSKVPRVPKRSSADAYWLSTRRRHSSGHVSLSQGTHAGRPRSALDMVVAAIEEANDCVVVTDNEKDLPGANLLNPLRSV
jgi:predicted nucleic acid-binding protein